MKIEVIHALRARQDQVEIELPDRATIAQAINTLLRCPNARAGKSTSRRLVCSAN